LKSGFSAPDRLSFIKRHPSSNDTVLELRSDTGDLLNGMNPKNRNDNRLRDALKRRILKRSFCFFMVYLG
jgi:hypothetical protein